MHKPSSFRNYFVAIFLGASILSIILAYLFIRRGYLFDAPSTADMLYVPNKAFAGAGVLMIAITFLIGPLSRYFDRFDSWLCYRKEIGIVGGFIVFGHVLISYFLLPKKSPQSRFTLDNENFIWGLIGTALLVFLFVISFRKMIEWIGSARWWFLQRWGLRLVILATVMHVVPMKWSGWVKWFNEGGKVTPELAHPLMPGAGILASLFVAWVITVRLYESIFVFKSFGFQTKEITPDKELVARGRQFFLVSFWVMIMLYIIISTRWIG
jgi:DMSO/TMAO reductase YedYZ heme-binding membrane subunit